MNIQKKRNHFPDRKAEDRVKDFQEVGLPIDFELAQKEAGRCLQCKHAPCITGCPVEIKIPEFILEIKNAQIKEAYHIIRKDHFLPSVCGRVCPQEKQCERLCVLAKTGEPVAIGKLEKFVGDEAIQKQYNQSSKIKTIPGKKAAVIGSGPASLACAGELIKNKIAVDVFEALHKIGGVLVYGIPEFRLPKKLIEKEIGVLKQMGVQFFEDSVVGRTIVLEELLSEYQAVFIGVGAGTPLFLNIPGEKLNSVFSANEFLTRINLMNAYAFPEYDTPIPNASDVIVIGGGNTAMDAARNAVRLGAKKVTVAYRRTENELPARKEEYHHAKEEGISFRFLISPLEIKSDESGKAQSVVFQKMELGAPDEKGRRSPIPIQDETELIQADMVIIAIGTQSNPLLPTISPKLKLNSKGYLMVSENLETSIPNVFAGGDIVTGAATVIQALGAGKKAARQILKKLEKE